MFTMRCVVIAGVLAGGVASADGFGSKDPGLYNLKGTIYFLPEDTEKMPPGIEKQKSEGTIYTEALDIAPREFTAGFPGVTNRFEWFGLVYTGRFHVAKAGDYAFRTLTDDGVILWIDGKQVLANDSIHGPDEATGSAKLKAGAHDIKLWYFQGPAAEIALQLWVTPPGGTEKIFSMKDYAGDLGKTLGDIGAEATKDGIRIRLDASVLFDVNKSDLKPAAQASLKKLATVLAAYPNAQVTIGGHTSSEGEDAYNQTLSEKRAEAVRASLGKLVPKTVKLSAVGYGETQPIADNKTEKTRVPNRRVEIFVKP